MSDLTITHAGSTVTTTSDGGLNKGVVIRVQPTLETSEYAVGDVLFAPIELPKAVRTKGGISLIRNMFIIDKEKQAQDYEIFLFEKSTSLGTVNATANISNDDFVTGNLLGMYYVDTDQSDSASLDNVLVSQVHNTDQARPATFNPTILQASSDSTSVYLTATCLGGTGTYAADSLNFVLHVEYLS